MTQSLILHEYSPSGNCYKIRLVAAHLGIALERRAYDITAGETRTPAFMRDINANGRIPVLEDGDRKLAESNAICCYLAHDSDLIPDERFDRADMLHWMFWEQYNHEPNIATLRFWLAYLGEARLTGLQRMQIDGKRAAGEAALVLMEQQLAKTGWLAANRFTLADICLYAYTHVAEEAGFDLAAYPAVPAWIAGIAAMPEHVTIAE